MNFFIFSTTATGVHLLCAGSSLYSQPLPRVCTFYVLEDLYILSHCHRCAACPAVHWDIPQSTEQPMWEHAGQLVLGHDPGSHVLLANVLLCCVRYIIHVVEAHTHTHMLPHRVQGCTSLSSMTPPFAVLLCSELHPMLLSTADKHAVPPTTC